MLAIVFLLSFRNETLNDFLKIFYHLLLRWLLLYNLLPHRLQRRG